MMLAAGGLTSPLNVDDNALVVVLSDYGLLNGAQRIDPLISSGRDL